VCAKFDRPTWNEVADMARLTVSSPLLASARCEW